eukprot:2945119-Alexandrium_andersonii.AAC.1
MREIGQVLYFRTKRAVAASSELLADPPPEWDEVAIAGPPLSWSMQSACFGARLRPGHAHLASPHNQSAAEHRDCLLYTSDAADDM